MTIKVNTDYIYILLFSIKLQKKIKFCLDQNQMASYQFLSFTIYNDIVRIKHGNCLQWMKDKDLAHKRNCGFLTYYSVPLVVIRT